MRVLHPHTAGLHSLDAPGTGAQQKDVARLNSRPQKSSSSVPTTFAVRLSDYRIICVLREIAPPEVMAAKARSTPPFHAAVQLDRDAGMRRCGRAEW